MKFIISLCVLLATMVQSMAEDLTCAYEGIVDAYARIEVHNKTDFDIVIMGGNENQLVHFGMTYLSKTKRDVKMILIGENLAMFEKPALILLPSKCSRQFKFLVNPLIERSQIIQLQIGISYLPYSEFSSKMKKSPNMQFEWVHLIKNIIYDDFKIKSLNLSYGFGLNLSGSTDKGASADK
jgi:hypothetical protein